VPTSIHELLDDLHAGALDERDKGDKFEQLIRGYLTTDPGVDCPLHRRVVVV
jgi:hypothetical protein